MESFFIPYVAANVLPNGKILVLAPHPDDEALGCGGAILQHRQQGNEVSVVFLTDGRAAETHVDKTAARAYIELRHQEARAAARILGYGEPIFWDIPDRQLNSNESLICKLVDLVKEQGFNVVYAPSVWEIHPDHYALAQAAMAMARRCGKTVNLFMYEVGVPLFPNLLLDITPFIDKKRQSVGCYASQLQRQDYRRHIAGLNTYRAYTLPPHVQMAEGYFCIDGETLEKYPAQQFGVNRQSQELMAMQDRIRDLEDALTQGAYEGRA